MIIIPNVNKENSCLDCPVWSLCWDSKPTEDICKDRCPIIEFEGVRLLNNDMPTIEAEPIVRCKDCKYRNGDKDKPYCDRINPYRSFYVGDNDFCSWGEKNG